MNRTRNTNFDASGRYEKDYTPAEELLFIWDHSNNSVDGCKAAIIEGNWNIREAILTHGRPTAFARFDPEGATHDIVADLDPESLEAIFNASTTKIIEA